MTVKDWVIMLVPIAANGLVLYIIQMYFQSRQKQNDHKNEVKQRINGNFFDLLIASKSTFRALNHCLVDEPGNTARFNQCLMDTNLSIRKVLDFYSDYGPYLKDYSNLIERLDSVFSEYVEMGRKLSVLDDASRKKLQDYLNELLKTICDAASHYAKEI